MEQAKVEYLAREAFWGANETLWRAIAEIRAGENKNSMTLADAIRIAVENADELVGVLAD